MLEKSSPTANHYPFYSPRFWNGMRVRDYFGLIHRHRYAVSWQRFPMLFLVGGCSIANSLLAAIQRWQFGTRISSQPIDPGPIFVVGHWRSGTTLLHELLALDDRFGYPTTLECFMPHHFLVSEPIFKPLLRLLLPSKRPMDNMLTGVDLPQEDEFALVAMGAPSPYQRIAFPNQPSHFASLLNMESLAPAVEREFAENLTQFLQSLMLKKNKRLILKSPTHTGRIAWLARHFPGSRFIHIARNPVEVFLSTKRLWQRLDEVQGFQLPKYSDAQLEEMVHRDYQLMYQGYLAGRRELAANQLIEIQFEQLIADAPSVFQNIYQQLELGDASHIKTVVAESMGTRRTHEAAAYRYPPEKTSEIMRQWSQYALTFGYEVDNGQPFSHSPCIESRA